jgi:hypothetical protein
MVHLLIDHPAYPLETFSGIHPILRYDSQQTSQYLFQIFATSAELINAVFDQLLQVHAFLSALKQLRIAH